MKVMVLGWDGATFSVLKPLLDHGIMPNLKALVTAGTACTLESTFPTYTGPGWASLATGKHPNKHGLFDWGVPTGAYVPTFINARYLRDKTIWQLLGERSIPSLVFNFPVTYPIPSDMCGTMVSGMFTPNFDVQWTWPPELGADILDKFKNYQIDITRRDYEGYPIEFMRALTQMTETRGRVLRHLLSTREWEFAVGVFVGTDRLQHFCWRFIEHLDEYLGKRFESRGLESEIRQEIVKYFGLLDRILGEVISIVGNECSLLIVSDHGFGEYTRKVNMNKILANLGFLRLKTNSVQKKIWIDQFVKSAVQYVKDALGPRRAMLRKFITTTNAQKMLSKLTWTFADFVETVDWANTIAYANTSNGVNINLSGREPHGRVAPAQYKQVLQELKQQLLNLESTGMKVFSEAWTRGEFLTRRAETFPDLVLRLADPGADCAYVLSPRDLRQSIPFPIFETPGYWDSGSHRLDGIFVAAGPAFRSCGEQLAKRLSIVDIMPTILHLFGASIPTDVDGEVQKELLTSAFRQWPISFAQAELAQQSEVSSMWDNPDEELAIEKRLRGLGYIE